MSFKDLTGQTFGRLTVIRRVGSNNRGLAMWECLCECGNIKAISGHDLRRGSTVSCGCFRSTHSLKHGAFRKGDSEEQAIKKKIYLLRSSMLGRCYCKNNSEYHRYGGRGIGVCEEWRNDATSFYNWAISNGYRPELSIDRIDNDKGYSPENCRFANDITQSNNRSNNHKVTYKGETHTIAQWGRILNISEKNISDRLRAGMPVEKAMANIDLRSLRFKDVSWESEAQ